MLRRIKQLFRTEDLTPQERQIAAERLPIPAETTPATRGVSSTLKTKDAKVAASVVVAGVVFAFGVHVGSWDAERQDAALDAAISDAGKTQIVYEQEAYDAHRDELEERGLWPGGDPAFGVFWTDEQEYAMRTNPPRDHVAIGIAEGAAEAEGMHYALTELREKTD